MVSERLILAFDTASPVVSIALGTAHALLAERTLELRRSSELLLRAIEAVLAEAGCGFGDLSGCAVLRGPGSFTGLRVGLGSALGFHQASGLSIAALPTLEVLAASLPQGGEGEIVAAVDALRGEWCCQRFAGTAWPPRPLGPPALWSATELTRLQPARWVGFGIEALAGRLAAGSEIVAAAPLAPVALRLAARAETCWDAALAVEPIYFRPPAVTLAGGGVPEEGRG